MDSSSDPADPSTKQCSRCRQWKPLGAFNRRSTAKDGRQAACRECNRQYHRDNWDRHMGQIRSRRKRVRQENQAKLWAYLASHPCVDCGMADPRVLDFDHLRDKRGNISRLRYSYDWVVVEAEIAKCEVVCANCHRIRTYERRRELIGGEEGDVGRLGFEPRPTTG